VPSSYPRFSLLIVFSILSCLQLQAQVVIHGQADLSEINFEKIESIDLSGSWNFYWNKLLTPENIHEETHESIQVPGSWGNYEIQGFATYHLQLVLPETRSSLSLYFPIINSAAKVWINDKLVEETGIVSQDKKLFRPKLSSTIVPLPDRTNEVNIIIQVANFNYYNGGIGSTPVLGKVSSLQAEINRSNGIENFFAGSLIAMFCYQLILYFLFQRGKPYLWLALICLGVALRALITHGGSFLLPDLYPSVDWEYWKKIEFGSVYAIVAIFPLYVYHLFPEQAPKKPIFFFVGMASILCITVIVTPQYVYGNLLEVSHIGLLLAFIYAVYSISFAWRNGNRDARIILLGVLASFPFILAEILKNSILVQMNIQFQYLVELGVLVFLLFQVYLLANHFAQAYRNLELLNLSLEKSVEERTKELTTANTVKDRLLSVMSHDIKSPLNSLRGILQLYEKKAISTEEFGHFAQRIENDLSKTNILVENILYWTASQLKGVQLNKERFDLNLLIEENIQLFFTIASQKKIKISHPSSSTQFIFSDRNILNFVIRNLIANAIKFSHEGGAIELFTIVARGEANIQIKDNGIGMDEETIRSVMIPDSKRSKEGTNHEKGTGLGITLCLEYLKKLNGQLTIESLPNKGSTFSIMVPLN